MTILVDFFDIKTDNVFASSEMLLEQLPETFEVQTTLNIGNEDWTVVEAIPPHSKDFSKTKKVTLKLSRQEVVDPQEILFSLPTVSAEFPNLEQPSTSTDYDILIHEDDYRQNEFLNNEESTNTILLKELNSIKVIWENNLEEGEHPVFSKCHIRKEIGKPNLKITIDELKKTLNTDKIGQVVIGDKALKNGFSIHTENTIYYGILNKTIVTEFCLAKWKESPEDEIKVLNKAFNLQWVSWIHCNTFN